MLLPPQLSQWRTHCYSKVQSADDEARLEARATECDIAYCTDGDGAPVDAASEACCNEQINGVAGLLSNSNLKVGYGGQDQRVCYTKEDGNKVILFEYQLCCSLHGATGPVDCI